MRGQGAMVREFTKWDYELRHASDLELVIDRALAIAMTEPRGPVYISLPREVLADPASATPPSAQPRQRAAAPPAPDPAALAEAGRLLAAARNPLILTARSGRDPKAVTALADFATATAMPVVEYWANHMNLPADHPMHAGHGPVTFEDPGEGEGQGEGQGGDKEEIDAVVVLEALVPWLPKRGNPAPDCPVIQIGPDPLHSATPIRGFPVTVGLTSTVANALPALQAAITDRWREDDRTAAQERRARLSAANDERRRLALAASQHTSEGLADHAWICHCLNEQKLPGDIIMNELGIDRGRDGIGFTEPNSFYGTSVAGGLGWGLPAALGAKLAQPDRTVIATVGDGSYMFANPLACHQMATALNLPILTIVFNNGRWNAVRASTLAVYPDGVASRANLMPLTTLEPAPEYDKVVEACGGHGEKVERAQDLPAALARALKIVRKGKQQVLLNVRCT